MDLIHKILNILLPLISLIIAIFFLPLYLLFKFLRSLVGAIYVEDVAGKHLAYEYAKEGAYLVLVARREDRLQAVREKAQQLGSPDVVVIPADVSNESDCKRFVDKALSHFGRLDHLVNNAGIAPTCMFEDYTSVTDHAAVMNTNFWGSVYSTQFAVPHLRKSKGKIIVISSVGASFPTPKLSIYSASKGALVSFYETLRIELGSDIGITIVTPGLVDSEITRGGIQMKTNTEFIPMLSTEVCAKAILNSTIRGERHLTAPAWVRVLLLWTAFCPEAIELCNRLVLITVPKTSPNDSTSKKILDRNGERNSNMPSSTQSPECKSD